MRVNSFWRKMSSVWGRCDLMCLQDGRHSKKVSELEINRGVRGGGKMVQEKNG